MRIAKLLSVVLIVVFAAGLIGCNKPKTNEYGAATQPAATVATVNAKCPMPMAGTFNKASVSTDLSRDFAGQNVGFCCAMCLSQWDALTEAEKTAKLAAVMAPVP